MKRIVVIGGGITGLAAAYELSKSECEITLVEKNRLGGVVATEREGDFLIEGGPDSFITMKPWAKELCEELDLADQLIPIMSRRVYVFSRGKLHLLPEGLFLTVPTKIWPFLKSSLISLPGKLRMGMDYFLPRGKEVEDESIGSFVRRRLGREALEKLAEPIMGGIYVAPADELSLRCTFPRFMDLERKHRSLIKALRKTPRSSASPFLALKDGTISLVNRLIERMPGVKFITGKSAVKVEEGWKVTLEDGTLDADAVIVAIPTHDAARLRPGLPEVKYVSTSVVTLAYNRFRELDGTGFVIPKVEGRRILACTWSSSKFAGRAPDDKLLVRCFLKRTEGDLVETACEEMREIIGAKEDPLFTRVHTWPNANPVYEVGHERRIREFDERLPKGITFAGAGFHGTGLPDCIRDGRAAAKAVLANRES